MKSLIVLTLIVLTLVVHVVKASDLYSNLHSIKQVFLLNIFVRYHYSRRCLVVATVDARGNFFRLVKGNYAAKLRTRFSNHFILS